MRIRLALLLLALSCGSPGSPVETRGALGNVGSAVAEGAGPQPVGCPFDFGDTWAIETPTAVRLLAHGSGTDAASVVTVVAHASAADCSPMIIYQSGVGDCLKGTPQSVAMVGAGADAGGESFTGVIPSFAAGTQVCWRISASACGVVLTDPAVGAASFDYTTR